MRNFSKKSPSMHQPPLPNAREDEASNPKRGIGILKDYQYRKRVDP